ncbi:hypothetical protein PR003_g17145 [Phytophthora rubi]|uniref:HTH CENPB-type domain-containing protein n=1 Tax=Phytophthora rubi TaxID=129364 RepID=A0A6A4EI31_9STRA|nr:hypothetical protein PR003_g17145 [Phytophthora rubi]
MTKVRDDTGIPYNTLKKYVSDTRGVKHEKKRPGSKPLLPKEAEDNLRDWELGRQHDGHPVVCHEHLEKAQQIAHLVSGLTMGEGWLRRFMERHLSLTLRASQSVSKCRNEALGVAALAWNHACLSSNLVAGFSTFGIFPLSRVNMHAKLANFECNGLPNSHRDAAWLQVCHIVRREILVLPARATRRSDGDHDGSMGVGPT